MLLNDSNTASSVTEFRQYEASPQVVSATKDSLVGVDFVYVRFATAVFANGGMPSNQSGKGDSRHAGRNFCPGRGLPFCSYSSPQQ